MAEETIENITHGLVAFVKDEENPEQIVILHFCGYFQEPTEDDYVALKTELAGSEDFGLQGIDFELGEATQEMLDYFKDPSRFEEEVE
jgi:hypothetical protein